MIGAGGTRSSQGERISFTVAATDALWRAAVTVPVDHTAQGHRVVPLPPQTDGATQLNLEIVARTLARRGIASTVPVDLVLAVGALGAMAARLFAWLTGSPLHLLAPERADLLDVVAACAGKRTVLLCCDTHECPFGLLEISTALGSEPVQFGFIYAFDLASALVSAFKAAFEPEPEAGLGIYVMNGTSGPEVDKTYGDLHVACGTVVKPERTQELLSAPSRVKVIVSHGNGFDFDLGQSVLCCIDGPVPKIDDPHLFPCFQTGTCIRTAQTRISVQSIRADVLIMATCWGVFDGADEIDYARTAYAPLVMSPDAWSLMTAVRQWTAGPRDWLRILGALSDSRTLGEAARRLNACFDPLHAAFLVFGNPGVRLRMPVEFALRALEPQGLSRRLTAGFQIVRIAPLAREDNGALIVCGDTDESLDGAELFVDRATSEERLLIFCPSPVFIVRAPCQTPAFDPLVYQRLSRGTGAAARLIRDLGAADNGALTARIEEARRLSILLTRTLDGRQLGQGYVLLPWERLALTLVDDLLRATTRDIVQAWSEWATHGTRPRFWSEAWRREFAQTAASVGPICSSCGKRTRSETYTSLAEPSPDRVLTFCRICSMRSDMPRDGAPTIAVRSIVHQESSFEACFAIENKSAHPVLTGAAVFFMSANHVWPTSVSSQDVAWSEVGQTLERTFTVPKPETYVPGSHWFVLVGLADGIPLTHCERVVLRQYIKSGEHVWHHPATRATPSDATPGP